VQEMRKIIGGVLILLAVLTGCGAAASSSAPGTVAASSSPAEPVSSPAPSGLPCDPQAQSCWVPQTASFPQEEFISYRPAQRYTTAAALAKAVGCTVQGSYGYQVTCDAGPAGILDVFGSVSAEVSTAETMQQYAENGNTDTYAVFGPGWLASQWQASDYSSAKQIQARVGGELICFSSGLTVDGDVPPCCATTANDCTP